MGMHPAPPTAILYRGSRRKAALAVLCCVGLIAVGLALINTQPEARHSSRSHFAGWVSISFFASYLPIALSRAIFPPTLIIDTLGFAVIRPWARRYFFFSDVNDIWVHYHRDYSWVVWTLRNRRDRPWWRLTGKYDGLLSGPWDCTAEEIAWEMNKAAGKLT